MTRNRTLLAGLATMLLVTGCRQLPTREGVSSPITRRAAPARDEKLESQLSLGRLSERHGQNDHAIQVYRSILNKHPQHPVAHHRLGVLLAQANEAEAADRHFEQALQNGSRSPDLLADIGYFFYLQDKLEDAESVLRESLAAQPGNKSARSNLALVLGEQERYDEALQEFKKCLPEAEAHANMGYVYAMCGDLDRAAVEYNTALSMDSSLRNAAEALLQLNERRKAERSIAQAQSQAAGDLARSTGTTPPERPDTLGRVSTSSGVTTASSATPVSDNAPRGEQQDTVQPAGHTEPTEARSNTRPGKPQQLIASSYDRPPSVANDRPQSRRRTATSRTPAAARPQGAPSTPPASPTVQATAEQAAPTQAPSAPSTETGGPARYSLSDSDSTDNGIEPIASGPFESTPAVPRRNMTGATTHPWQQTTWTTQK